MNKIYNLFLNTKVLNVVIFISTIITGYCYKYTNTNFTE